MKGDVVQITQWVNRPLPQPWWGIISDNDGHMPDFILLLGGDDAWSVGDQSLLNSIGGDAYEIVPPEQWPDEVCHAVALHKMGLS